MLKYLLFPPLLLYASISFAFWGPDCNSAKDCLQKGYEAMTAQKAADYFEDEADAATQKMTAALEPCMIIIMAIIVGLVVGGIGMPILTMAQWIL